MVVMVRWCAGFHDARRVRALRARRGASGGPGSDEAGAAIAGRAGRRYIATWLWPERSDA